MPGPLSTPGAFRKVSVSGAGNVFVTSGKTKRDKESGKWGRRLMNRKLRGDRDRGMDHSFGKRGK